jgi:DNA-binding response OmpR family regulator
MITARGRISSGSWGWTSAPTTISSNPSRRAKSWQDTGRAAAHRPEDAPGRQIFSYDNLMVNLDEYTVSVGGHRVPLTKKETEILCDLPSTGTRCFPGQPA